MHSKCNFKILGLNFLSQIQGKEKKGKEKKKEKKNFPNMKLFFTKKMSQSFNSLIERQLDNTWVIKICIRLNKHLN